MASTAKKTIPVPVNSMAEYGDMGIVIERMVIKDLGSFIEEGVDHFGDAQGWHREDRHSFFILESGTVHMEMDFQKYTVRAPSVTYIHPDQVHRILSVKNISVVSLAINNENLNPEYLKILEEIRPVKSLVLKKEAFSIISEAVSLCLKLAGRNKDRLYHASLKDSSNALASLMISQYLEHAKSSGAASRFDIVTKAFRQLLELHYITDKRPAAYAQKLNISTPYLNECVKNTTGYPVSHHIHQRVILEAKRMLYHSNKSVKEVAADLGYDDYPYFSRLFAKVTGMSALAFRTKNLD